MLPFKSAFQEKNNAANVIFHFNIIFLLFKKIFLKVVSFLMELNFTVTVSYVF